MKLKRDIRATAEGQGPEPARMPPPVPDGIEYMESLGRWVDNLLGDARIQAAADREIAESGGDTAAPPDPPPAEPPPPVEDGNDVISRGADPDQTK